MEDWGIFIVNNGLVQDYPGLVKDYDWLLWHCGIFIVNDGLGKDYPGWVQDWHGLVHDCVISIANALNHPHDPISFDMRGPTPEPGLHYLSIPSHPIYHSVLHLVTATNYITGNLYITPVRDTAGIPLTHWSWDKMAAFSQTTFSNAFSSMKMFEFRLQFHWSLFLRVQLTIFQPLFR